MATWPNIPSSAWQPKVSTHTGINASCPTTVESRPARSPPQTSTIVRATRTKEQTRMCLAVPGKIISISGDELLTRTGRVNFGGIVKEASLAYVPEAKVGNYVIVHVGFAISMVDEQEAQRVFEYLR